MGMFLLARNRWQLLEVRNVARTAENYFPTDFNPSVRGDSRGLFPDAKM
jgi:hypothetical protein